MCQTVKFIEKKNIEASKSLEHMTLSKQNETNLFLSSNESSNNNLSAETDIRFIDGIEENNSLLRSNYSDNQNSRNNAHQPVKFVTSFHNIKEIDDKAE